MHRIAYASQRHRCTGIGTEAVEKRALSVTPLHKAWRGDADLWKTAVLRIPIKMDDSLRLMKWQAAQEKIVNQTEDCSVKPDPERQRDYRKQGESGRFEQLPKREPQIDHHKRNKIVMRSRAHLDSTTRRRRCPVLSVMSNENR